MKALLDFDYLEIVNNILNDEKFKDLDRCLHHGTTRYEHSIRVSYLSYKIAKKNNLDYITTARAGLLHDFFNNEGSSMFERFKSTFTHPSLAVENAKEIFNITEKESKIIRSHMFPINLTLPRSMEAWIVTISDKIVFLKEISLSTCYKLRYATNLFILILLNFIK